MKETQLFHLQTAAFCGMIDFIRSDTGACTDIAEWLRYLIEGKVLP